MAVEDQADKSRRVHESLELLVAQQTLLGSHGLNCDLVSCGGTGTIHLCSMQPGISEIQAGGAIFMTSPLDWLDDELGRLRKADLLRTLGVRSTPQRGERIELNGQELVNFGSNDYLGIAASLAEDPGFRRTIDEAIQTAGWGAGASPLITGRGVYHSRLEQELAKFEGTEAALLFPTGFAANAGTVAALAGPGDIICSDALNHASLIDGCRLSGAKVLIYRHDNNRLVAKSKRMLCRLGRPMRTGKYRSPSIQLARLR